MESGHLGKSRRPCPRHSQLGKVKTKHARRGWALAAILRRRKRHNWKRSGSSRWKEAFFHSWRRYLLALAQDGEAVQHFTSTESGKGYTQFLGKLTFNFNFTSIYILRKSSIVIHQILWHFSSFLSDTGSLFDTSVPFLTLNAALESLTAQLLAHVKHVAATFCTVQEQVLECGIRLCPLSFMVNQFFFFFIVLKLS